MKRGSKIIFAAAVAVALVAATTGCRQAQKGAPSGTASDSMPLEAAARKEGLVNLWATNAEDVNWIPAAFEKTFPGIKVQIFTDTNVTSRVIAEDRGGVRSADLVWNSEGLIYPLIDRELLVGSEWSKLGVRNEDISAGEFMAITSSAAYAVAYRTDRVPIEEVPKSWGDLTDDRYKRKMAASPFLFARLTAGLGAFETKEKWLDFSRKIYANSHVLWSNDLLEQAIVSGERPFVVGTANYLAERWKARGLPIEVVLPEPVFITNFGCVLLKNAPHPNAARILGVWLASPEGRAAREKSLLAVDLRPSSTHPKAIALRESGKRIYLDARATTEIRNSILPQMDRVLSGLD
jgi:iron(III) transport system substrate-binding protein